MAEYTFCLGGDWIFPVWDQLFSIRINETERWIDKVDTVIEIDEKRTGVSEELIWVIAGLCSIFGTCVVGLILSYTIRPFFVLRYLYPTVPVAYMLLIYCTRKMKLKKILFVIDFVDSFQ